MFMYIIIIIIIIAYILHIYLKMSVFAQATAALVQSYF